jgi:ketosteroid isomerase-like protein
MTKRSVLAVLTAVAMMGTACQLPTQEATGLSEADLTAINELVRRWAELENAGDWEAVVALHTEDAVWMPPNEKIVEGRAAMQAWAANAEFNVLELSAPTAEIDGRDGLAYVRASYDMTFQIAGLDEPIKDIGKWVALLRKQPDGVWKVTVNIWNSDLPPSQESSTSLERNDG